MVVEKMTKGKERLKERKREMMREDELGKLRILLRAVDTGGGGRTPLPLHHTIFWSKKKFFSGKIRVDEREGVSEKSDKK